MVTTIEFYSHTAHRFSAFGAKHNVPPEIAVQILSFLNWRQLVSCSSVNRVWQQLINGTLSLQYKIELGANGLVDGAPGAGGVPTAVPERMRALCRRQEAWRKLAFRRCERVPMPGECQAYELTGGTFVKAMHSDAMLGMDGTDIPAPMFVGPLIASRHMRIVTLPGAANDESRVIREDIGFSCRDFAIDPTQDLMAMVEHCEEEHMVVHLRTISSNKPHPVAVFPILKLDMKIHYDGTSVYICDDVVAVVVRLHNIPRVMIWQWTSGRLLVSELHSSAFRFVDGFSLISNYAFITTCRIPGSIKVYTFRDSSASSSAITEPLSPESVPIPARAKDLPCTTLLLPTLQCGALYTELDAHTAPFVAHVPAQSPWYPSEDARLHVLNVLVQPMPDPIRTNMSQDSVDANAIPTEANEEAINGTPPPPIGVSSSFIIILKNKILLRYADAQRNIDQDSEGKGRSKSAEVRWEEWGPTHSRWLQEQSSNAWLRFIHGSRMVHATQSAWPSAKCKLKILDFNVQVGRQRRSTSLSHKVNYFKDVGDDIHESTIYDDTVEQCLVIEPTTVGDISLFREGGVESKLPYRMSMLRQEIGPYSGFMIDEERIIGVPRNPLLNRDMTSIDVFTF